MTKTNKNTTNPVKNELPLGQSEFKNLPTQSKTIKRKPHDNYKFITMDMRINVIYDSFIHGIQPLDIS